MELRVNVLYVLRVQNFKLRKVGIKKKKKSTNIGKKICATK